LRVSSGRAGCLGGWGARDTWLSGVLVVVINSPTMKEQGRAGDTRQEEEDERRDHH
jgi:hypothetical protein